MIAPVTLLDPAGNVVSSFGDGGAYTLKSGDSRSWEGKWNVTQAQLDAGTVIYTLRYHLEDASGALVDGHILESWASPVKLISMKAKSPVNASMEEELEAEEGVEYVNAYFLCECGVDLNNLLNITGTQEIRLGRSYYLKSVDFEYSSTIISLEKIEG